jgi:hypothetical protein
MIPGFADHKHELTAREYVDAVVRGDLVDPTLTMQLSNDFEALGVISEYVDDATTNGWASFIVWFNPDIPRSNEGY